MLFNHDAYHYGQMIRSGETTSSALVEACIQNFNDLNQHLNVTTATYFDQARERAHYLDNKIQSLTSREREQLSPFYGVPLLLKDIGQYWKGTVTSSASKLLQNQVAHHTDASIQLLEEAGFVFLGRSNIPEFGLKTVSDSPYYGAVNNPINLDYNPGGSSGGAASAVKSGMFPLATGSDAGGSIRVPASDTGLIGLKPSRGRVAEGPGFYRPVNGLATNLVMAKSVRDVFHYLKIVQKNQVTNMNSLPEMTEETIEEIQTPLRIAYSLNHPLGDNLSASALATMIRTLDILDKLGHELIEIDLDIDGDEVMHYYRIFMIVETGKILYRLAQKGQKIRYEDVDPLSWICYQLSHQIPAFEYSDGAEKQDRWIEQMEELFQSYDLFLTPTTADIAMRNDALELPKALRQHLPKMRERSYHEQMTIAEEAFNHYYRRTPFSALFNITGQPAISLPLYENEDGMPLGSQFATGRGNEYLLIQMAHQLEQEGYLLSDIHPVLSFD